MAKDNFYQQRKAVGDDTRKDMKVWKDSRGAQKEQYASKAAAAKAEALAAKKAAKEALDGVKDARLKAAQEMRQKRNNIETNYGKVKTDMVSGVVACTRLPQPLLRPATRTRLSRLVACCDVHERATCAPKKCGHVRVVRAAELDQEESPRHDPHTQVCVTRGGDPDEESEAGLAGGPSDRRVGTRWTRRRAREVERA